MAKTFLELDATVTKYLNSKIQAVYVTVCIIISNILNIVKDFAVGILLFIICILGFISLFFIISSIFDNELSLAELSKIEWLFFILSGLLFWRISYYCRLIKEGILKVIYRIGLAFGVFALLLLCLVSIASSLLDQDLSAPFFDVVGYICIFIVLYLSIPERALSIAIAASKDDGDHTKNDSSVRNMVDENEIIDDRKNVKGTWEENIKGGWGND